jgi:hypothetical protein
VVLRQAHVLKLKSKTLPDEGSVFFIPQFHCTAEKVVQAANAKDMAGRREEREGAKKNAVEIRALIPI